MSGIEWCAVALTVGLFVYLCFAMFFPERFS